MLRIRYFGVVAFVLLSFSNTNAQLFKPNWNDFTFRKAKDKWTTDDKGFHAFGSAYLYSVLAKKMPKGYAALTTIALGAAWEVKDAYVRHDVVPILGGDGFSYKDLTFDVGGVALGLLRDLLFKDKNSKPDKL
ncbi:hypothetical protein L0337_15820 [candidate division KSB1 bacterium]|nr:hypothetical protein [candidate division KSB1 bacterium]